MFTDTQPYSSIESLMKKTLLGLSVINQRSDVAIRRQAKRQLAYLPEYLKRDIGLIDD